MTHRIELPDYDSKDAVFFVMMLKGHILNKENFPQLTGIQDAPVRYWRLNDAGVPIHVEKHLLPSSKYDRPIGFYSIREQELTALYAEIGGKRLARYIDRVVKHWDYDADVKKGLQSKPQPLSAILSGQALNSEVTNK